MKPVVVIVAGVSGCGKTTTGIGLAELLGATFFDADDFHPAANVEKMRAGLPLNDEDRAPWLANLNEALRSQHSQGKAAILACSALKQAYRQTLAQGLESVQFIHLKGDRQMLFDRMQSRQHRYMPASLLDSQFATLEPFDASAIELDVAEPLPAVIAQAHAALQSKGLA
jgi:gluconokinase